MAFNANDYHFEINEINEKIKEFQRTEEKADESFLEVGNMLVALKNEKQLNDKMFRQLKKEVAQTVSIRNINKVVSVAECDVIQKNKDRLPKGWGSLYLLSRMENLEELIKLEKVTPTTTRAGINALKEKPQSNPRIVVELITEEYITAELIAELTAALSNTSWSFVIK